MKRKTKMKKKSLILILIILAVLIAFFEKKTFNIGNSKETKIILNDLNIEVYSETNNLDLIKEIKNGKITSKKEKIDTNSLGRQEIKITYLDKNEEKKEYKFSINVVDTEKPTITFTKELYTSIGKKINLLKGVSAKDNYSKDIKVFIDGDYDFDREGEYIIYYIAKDSSGNETKEEAKLIVGDRDNITNEFTTSKGFKGYTKNGITYIDGVLIANKTYGLPQSYGPGLTKETETAINSMAAAAATDGINVYCQSGFRSFETQKRLYNNYSQRDGVASADIYSARPGYSEHQSGLACDLCSKDNSACINSDFDNSSEAKWLANNAYKFGLILRYPKGKTDETGYIYESWHYRYVGIELAKELYNNGDWITLEDYFGITSEYN